MKMATKLKPRESRFKRFKFWTKVAKVIKPQGPFWQFTLFCIQIDSVMSARTSNEHAAMRRLKSEFLVQFDGVTSNSNDLVTVIGATNRPQELDDAVLRRLVKKIYIPLPDENSRKNLLKNNLKGEQYSLPSENMLLLTHFYL
ncbi:putative microtubule-severing ATPase [Helianthus anomalus]